MTTLILKMAKQFLKDRTKGWQECGATITLTWMQNNIATLENSLVVSYIVKHDSAVSLPVIYSQ